MSVKLRLERARPEHSGRGLVNLDLEAMKKEQLSEEDVVEVRGRFGRSTLARVGVPLSGDTGKGVLRLDQYLRQAIKCSVGEMVEVRKVSVGTVERLTLTPTLDISGMSGIEAYLVQSFASRGLVVNENSVLFASFPAASLGWGLASSCSFKAAKVEPGPGVITLSTALELQLDFKEEAAVEPEVTFEDVGGLARQIELVRELVEIPLRFPDTYRHLGINPPRGIILYGPPGAGKTHLCRAVAREIGAKIFYINGPEIIGTSYGETESNLRQVFHKANSCRPSIILVDEVDVIGPKRGESGAYADTRMATQFLDLLDGIKMTEGVMVIGTTNRIDAMDISFRRPGRFDREIYIGPPDTSGRLEILQIHTRGMPLSDEAQEALEEIAEATLGFVGADLMELCREAGLNALRRQLRRQGPYTDLRDAHVSLAQLIVESQDFEQALTTVRPSALRESLAVRPDVSWEDIGGLHAAKKRLREVVEQPLLHPEVFTSLKIKPPSGVLLYGPPGTGKTLLAKAIASRCRANFISVKGAEIFSQWVGESEKQVEHVFRVARQVAPAILFFDQLDALAPRRSPGAEQSKATERVISQFLTELEGIEPLTGVIVIGATNRLDLLDLAILTPGRLGVHIYVPLPDKGEREEILRIHLKGVVLDSNTPIEEVLELLLSRTEGYSGAELEALCLEAKLEALRSTDYEGVVPLNKSHFLPALENLARSRLTDARAQPSPKTPAESIDISSPLS